MTSVSGRWTVPETMKATTAVLFISAASRIFSPFIAFMSRMPKRGLRGKHAAMGEAEALRRAGYEIADGAVAAAFTPS